MEKGVISSTGEKEHVETPSGRDVCQVPCHTTSSYHSDTFFSLIALTLQLVFGRWHRGLGVLGYFLLGGN